MPLEEILAYPDVRSIARLLAALGLSGFIGWDREHTGKAAGLRTHMLVGIGAASFVILGELLERDFTAFGAGVEVDPLRIIQAVVVGIGFIGAGTIFVSRGKNQVIGLTTAASIWATAGVGMLVGAGSYLIAVFATVLIVCVLRLPAFLPGSTTKDEDRKK